MGEFLDGFGVPFEVVGGNHDLEGIDEFPTDESNMEAYLRILGKPTPQFIREIAPKTLMIGLGSVLFRDAVYTSHEVVIDDAQIEWFENTVKAHPAEDGWKIFVFSHAPPMGSGLRVLQENHVVNGCCWLNHSGGDSTRKFIEIVRKNSCIKAWFSGHFHLGQDYEDSLTFPEGNNRGSCVFAQTSVMGRKSTRDSRRQSRLVEGNKDGFNILTVNHVRDGEVRLDATIKCDDNGCDTSYDQHPHEDYDHEKFMASYIPTDGDGCYLADPDDVTSEVCWWHMSCGRVLGKHNGMLLEYDPSTLPHWVSLSVRMSLMVAPSSFWTLVLRSMTLEVHCTRTENKLLFCTKKDLLMRPLSFILMKMVRIGERLSVIRLYE